MVWFFESLYNKTGTKNKTKQRRNKKKRRESENISSSSSIYYLYTIYNSKNPIQQYKLPMFI